MKIARRSRIGISEIELIGSDEDDDDDDTNDVGDVANDDRSVTFLLLTFSIIVFLSTSSLDFVFLLKNLEPDDLISLTISATNLTFSDLHSIE